MCTEDFITELFVRVRVDDRMAGVPKHQQAALWPGEVVTLAMLYAIKGVGGRAYYRWISRDYLPLFPHLPERTRLFRLFTVHPSWVELFLAEPTTLAIADTYGIELVHPRRQGRSKAQIGKKGKSNSRWIVGGKLCFVLNQWGEIIRWDADTANVYDATFHPLIRRLEEHSVVLADSNFHSKAGDPPNLKVCRRGSWGVRIVERTPDNLQ